MKRVTCWIVMFFACFSPGWTDDLWPEPILPKNAIMFLEVPAPDRALRAVQDYVNSVLGFPLLTDLEDRVRYDFLSGITLSSLDFTRPFGIIATGTDIENPGKVFYFPIAGAREFVRDFSQPYSGESLLKEDGRLLVYEMPDSSSYYLTFVGDYVLAGDDRQSLSEMAAIPKLADLLTERPNPRITGDLFAYLPRRMFDLLSEKAVSESLSDFERESAGTTWSASEQAAARQALTGLLADVFRQPRSLTLAVSLTGRELGVGLRLTPTPESGLARWIAANPGSATLPYARAVPDGAVMAVLAHLDAASLEGLWSYLEARIFPHLVEDATDERETRDLLARLREFAAAFTGELMQAVYRPAGEVESATRTTNVLLLGTRDAAAAQRFLDAHKDVLFPLLHGAGVADASDVPPTLRTHLSDGVTAYTTSLPRSVVAHRAAPAIRSVTTYAKSHHTILMLAGRRPMLATLERCLDADDAAVFHPQAPRFPGPKWAMARLRIEAVMRAFGWPAPDSPSGEAQVDRADYVERLLAGLPEPPPDSSIFAFAMPRNGDVAIRLVIPESEVTFAKLVFVRSMFLSTAGGGETENTPLDEK